MSVEVDSLQPTLRWESFPQPQDHEADKERLLSRISEVTYDLKIWRAEEDFPADVIYTRQGLSTPYHKVEHALEPSTKYFWTIRARFEVGGHPRVTEWGGTEYPWQLQGPLDPSPRRLARIPNPNLYLFKTPPK